tara:strand:+ start:2604 stop:8834 length:6231 start_codon:yes stop_codon:yes gene_type:complete
MGGKSKDKRQARPVVTDISAVEISGAYWVTRSFAEVGDLISEGPIEGIVSGDYSYQATENQTGYDTVSFSQYSATGAAGGAALPELGFLRSIYWNKVPIVDKHGYYNFQDINVEHNFGDPIGALPTLSANLGDGNDFDLSVERGIGERLFGPQVKGYDKGALGGAGKDYSPGRQGEEDSQPAILEGAIDRYAKTYTIYNKECSDLQVNIKADALFEQILAGPKLFEENSELKPCNVADVGYGDTKARTIEYNIYYMPLFDERFNPAREDADQEDGAFTDLWTLAVEKGKPTTEKIFGKIDFPYIRTTTINVNSSYKDTPGFQGWKIRIVRLTPESLTSFLTNRTFVHSIVEVYGTRLRYPYTSMVYSRFDAKNFQQVPHRAYDTKLLRVKVPSNYNPVCKTYGDSDAANDLLGQRTGAKYLSGSSKWVAQRGVDAPKIFWDGEFKKDADGEYIREWTDNPAWCFYDLVTNPRYGLGEYITESDVDKWSLYEIAQYCDGMVPDGFGSYEPRFSMNYIITSREEAFKVLNDLSSMFRGITYYAHGSIFAIQDKYKDPVFQFNNSNVTQGDFTYSSSSKKARHSVAIIRYNDKRDNFQPAVEYMEDEESVRKYGILELQTTALGCTSKGQARRFGKWILASESEETETVQFGIGHEGGLIRPGDVVQIYDNYRSPLKRSGRTNAVIPTTTTTYFGAGANTVTGNSIILDSAMEFTSDKSYNFSLLTPTFTYNATQIDDLNSSGVKEISRSQIQNLVFSGSHARVITGSYKSEYYEGGSGICTEIYFSTGEAFGGQSNQLDFDNYVITGYTNTGVNTNHLANTVEDYSGGCFSGENLIWSVEPSNAEDPEFVSGNFSNFRIINIKETDDSNYSVAALAYSTGKYETVDSSVKIKDLSYYESPEFPTGDYDNLSAALLEFNTSLNLAPDKPFQDGVEDTKYESILIDFAKAGYKRTSTRNNNNTFTPSVEINDELTYLVSITTSGNPNQHTYATGDSSKFLYTVPTSDYKNIYKPNTNFIITPEDTLYTDVHVDGRITAEILITEPKDYYVTVFAANGAGRLSQGIQRKIDAVEGLVFFTAINHISVSNLTTEGKPDTSTFNPVSNKVQEDLKGGEPGFIWTPGFETSLLNAPVDNNEGPGGLTDVPTYPLQMLENDVDWRVTLRAPSLPSSPNTPNADIYLEFTGYQSDPSWPSFVFTTTYNNPSLINDLNSRNLATDLDITGYRADGGGIYQGTNHSEVGYYLVDPSGMIVKNDINAFPLRTFDIVVEPHDKSGKTSQNHYVWSNTIYNIKGQGAVNTNKGTETYNKSTVNNKYDIFGANIAPPSGVIFVPQKPVLGGLNSLMGGGNDNFISPEKAYERDIPYVATAMLLPDGSFSIGLQPSENLQGAQIHSEEDLAELFKSARGMVFYYTVGDAARPASDFTLAPENIPNFTTKVSSGAVADGAGNAFGGIIRNAEPGTTVYRGFYVFGENDTIARMTLKIPQIRGDAENINLCGALFDTLSLARAFTQETLRPRFYGNDSVTGTSLIYLDRDMNFNVRVSASTNSKYKLDEAGQLDLDPEGVPFGQLNKPIKITEFSMISPSQKGLSNQSWGQLYIDLHDFKTLKNVVSYDGAVKTGHDFYRPTSSGGTKADTAQDGTTLRGYSFPLESHKSLRMWEGGCHTLPMMLANAYCREFLKNNQKIGPLGESDPAGGSVVHGTSTSYRGHKWEGMDMSKQPWFIMGYQDPREKSSDGKSLYQGYLSDAYTSQDGGPKLNPGLNVTQRQVVDSGGLDKMRALLDSIKESDLFGGFNVLAAASMDSSSSGQGLGNKIRYANPSPKGDRVKEGEPTENLYDAEQAETLFWPFTTAYNSDFGGDTTKKYSKTPSAPIWRTVYEIPYEKELLDKSITQNIDKNNIVPKLKIIEITQPDLPYMLLQPGGERSPTGWRVRHYAYIEVTVYFTNELNATNKYIVNPLEGYMGSTRETFENREGLDGVLYDSEQRFGESSQQREGAPKLIWEAVAGGLIKMPHNFGPRLIRKNPTSFTFVLGAPSSWNAPDGSPSLLLSDWIGPQALKSGRIDSNLGFNLINFAVLKSSQ